MQEEKKKEIFNWEIILVCFAYIQKTKSVTEGFKYQHSMLESLSDTLD